MLMKKMNEELEEIPVVASTGGFDKSLYEGYRVPIEALIVDYVQDVFPDGKTYDPDSTKKKWILRVVTAPLKVMKKDEQENFIKTEEDMEFENEDGTRDKLKITHELNFQTQKDASGKEIMSEYTLADGSKEMRPQKAISKHPNATLFKFLRKMGCADDYRKLVGKIVLLNCKPAAKEGDDRVFINIVTG